MFENWPLYVLIGFITGAAFFVQRITGFGSAILAIPMLALFWNPHKAINLILIYQFMFGVVLLPGTWTILKDKKLKPFMILFVPTILLGAYVLPQISESLVKLLISVVIILVLIQWLFFPKVKVSGRFIPYFTGLNSILSGLIQGSFGTGGPFFLLFWGSVKSNKDHIRDGSIAVFAIANLLRLPVAYSTAQITSDVITGAIYTLPFFGLGMLGGNLISRRVNESQFRFAIIAILAVSALNLIF